MCLSLVTRDPGPHVWHSGSLETALEDSVDPFVDPVNSLHYPVSFSWGSDLMLRAPPVRVPVSQFLR